MNAVKLTFMVKSASPPRGGYFTVAATDCSREFGFHDVTFSGSPARRCIDWGDGTVQDFASGSHTKVRISRRLHDWLTQNAGWYAANPNLGLPNGTVEIRD